MGNANNLVFIDTSAWIALTDKSDKYFRKAVNIYNSIKEQRAILITTDYIIAETVTRIRYDAGHNLAIQFLDQLPQAEKMNALKILNINSSLFNLAVSIFRKYKETSLSFADCTSFAVCDRFKIREAFAFDQHFLMMGISLVAES